MISILLKKRSMLRCLTIARGLPYHHSTTGWHAMPTGSGLVLDVSGVRGQASEVKSVKVRGTAGHPLSCEAEAGMEAAGRKHLGGQKDK